MYTIYIHMFNYIQIIFFNYNTIIIMYNRNRIIKNNEEYY